ncbi:MAG TPA: type II toxin-antitoxin system RelE/ParE family toxin [Sporichthyaceae bacterium]|nr:type II toxin-antitoxin system RelE/ParE family toxin [Sporichthyaceae bacterium]
MSYALVWTEPAMTEYRKLRGQDRPGAKTVSDAVRGLAIDPQPAGTRQLGSTEFRRMRVGAFRILYRLDEEASAVIVEHVGRIPGGRAD